VKLSLNLSEASNPTWLDQDLVAKLRRIAETLEQTYSPVDIILVDDHYIRKINREFRGVDRATDVISFSYMNDSNANPAGDDRAGEVYVSYETLEREANTQGIDVKNLFLRIGVHGLLHILGFRHKSALDAQRMEQEERRLLNDELALSEVDELF
jgi:probable rRNA maturation factor